MANPRTLVVLGRSSIDDDGHQWVEVMPTGEELRNGPYFFTITSDDLRTYAASLAQNAGLVPIDYDHSGSDEGGSTVAAGWFTGETQIVQAGQVNPDGDEQAHESLWARVKWTPQARAEIQDGRFKRMSPEFTFAARDAKTGLMTRAKEIVASTLTNRPFFSQLAALADDQAGNLDAALELLEQTAGDAFTDETRARARTLLQTIGGEAAPTERNTMHESLKAVAAELGLADDATDEQVIEAVKAAKTAKPDQPKDGEVVLSKEQVDTLTANAAAGLAAKTELDGLKVKTRLDEAVRAGKLTPAQRGSFEALAAVDMGAFEKAIDELPAGVFKLTAVGTGSNAGGDGDQPVAPPEPIKVNGTRYDVDPDTFSVFATATKDAKPKTQDELVEALTAAGYDSTIDESRIDNAA